MSLNLQVIHTDNPNLKKKLYNSTNACTDIIKHDRIGIGSKSIRMGVEQEKEMEMEIGMGARAGIEMGVGLIMPLISNIRLRKF